MRERGEDKSRTDAPEAESLGADFWSSARVVTPGGEVYSAETLGSEEG
jgi:hypothetical protein